MNADADARALLREAAWHQRGGRLGEAIAIYRRLLTRWPDRPDTWYNLARLQRQVGDHHAALDAYQQALDRRASLPEEIHLNRGVIYADDLHHPADAERELAAALALNPRYTPALLNLANLQTDLGRLDAAIATYERLLAIDPGCNEALARYVQLKGVARPDDPLVARVRAAIGRSGTPPHERASLGFALGKLLDDCGAYDDAFAAYAAANRDSRASAPANAVLYDRLAQERLVDKLIEMFPTAGGKVADPAPDARPVFICGMFRSGSTLTEQVLAGHPAVSAAGEIPFLPNLAQRALAPFPDRMRTVTPAELGQLAAQYLGELQRLFPEAGVVTDKRPDNFLYIGLIKSLFPRARIVHTVRHPLDNGLSIHFLHVDHRIGYALDLGDIAHYYRHYRRLMAHWAALYGQDILDFDYDVLVRDPGPAVGRLLEFCDLPWDDGCLAFHTVGNAVKTASALQVREPLYRRASGRWRNYAAHLDPLRQALEEIGCGCS